MAEQLPAAVQQPGVAAVRLPAAEVVLLPAVVVEQLPVAEAVRPPGVAVVPEAEHKQPVVAVSAVVHIPVVPEVLVEHMSDLPVAVHIPVRSVVVPVSAAAVPAVEQVPAAVARMHRLFLLRILHRIMLHR